jgi:hypothetical protein
MQAAWHGKAPQWCDAVTLFRARTYKVSFVNSAVHVRFAPKATELLRDSKMTRGAKSGLMHRSKKLPLFDHLVGAGDQRRRDR